MYSDDQLVILDADGTTIDAFSAIDRTFAHHGMDIGPLARFQKRRNIFKYLGGLKEFPKNLQRQIGSKKRSKLITTLTEVYREEASLYPGMRDFILRLASEPRVRVGVVTRNITREPLETLGRLFERHGIDRGGFDFLVHAPLKQEKLPYFRETRERFEINPARSFSCGDEAKDYSAAVNSGIHPFMVSYGFEDFSRLTERHAIPAEVISRTPEELAFRVLHALELPTGKPPKDTESAPADAGQAG